MEAKAFEAMVTMLKEHSATHSLLFAEIKALRTQIQGNTGPGTPTIPATAAPKVKKKGDEVDLCNSDSESGTPVLPRRRSPRQNKGLRKVKEEMQDGASLKRSTSFEDSIRNSRARSRARKRKSKPAPDKLLRKSLGLRLSILDADLVKGKFHASNGRFKEDTFYKEVAPLIKEEIGSDFSDEELPHRYAC